MNSIKILLAEHHDALRNSISRFLKRQKGIELVEARSGSEAIASASQCTPNLVVVDTNMPDEDGIAVTKEIKRRLPSARVFIITSHDSATCRWMTQQSSADGIIEKRAMKDALLSLITTERTRLSVATDLSPKTGK